MSQPDNHLSLQIAALTDANDILRDENFRIQERLARQGQAYYALIKDLRTKASLSETTAVRAALYAEVAEQMENILTGRQTQ